MRRKSSVREMRRREVVSLSLCSSDASDGGCEGLKGRDSRSVGKSVG